MTKSALLARAGRLDELPEAPIEQHPRSEQLRDAFGVLSPADLSALIGVDERTLAVWRAQRRGPDFVKLGRAVFYRRGDILAWIELNVSPTDRAA
jgi:predicted DNA-binding transcriptional regulator AlpA